MLTVIPCDHSGNRHSLCFIGEEPKAERLYSWPKVTCLSNGRAGTYTQVAFCFWLLISSVKIHRDLSYLSPLKQSIWHSCPCLRNGWVIQALNQLRYQVVGKGERLLSSRYQPARPQAGGCQCWRSGTAPAGLVTGLCAVCCPPAPGRVCCQSWHSSSLGHWCAAGVQQKTSQSTPGGCVLQEVNFLQIRIDENRNLGVSRATQSNLKYELISQLERVSMSCFSLALDCASYLMWKVNRQINPSAQPRLEEQAGLLFGMLNPWVRRRLSAGPGHRGDPVLDIKNISSLPLGHINSQGTGKGTPCHSWRLWLPSDCGVTAA